VTPVRVAVVGGGLVGLATAYQILRQRPDAEVTVLEKEPEVCSHQSGRNSGVLHAGLAYKPGSSKALLAKEGVRLMTEFCQSHGIAHRICGKVILATNSAELARLAPLRQQGEANGLNGLRILSADEVREKEPHAGGLGALWVPEEGIVDYAGVGRALVRRIAEAGGKVVTSARVLSITRKSGEWNIESTAGQWRATFLVNCAGLHADRVCAMAGHHPSIRIVPFRGEYYRLRADRASLVNGLIYPLADPKFPFLGVHLTRRIDGTVDAGPNAILALAREGYSWSAFNARDMTSALIFRGLWAFLAKHPRHSWQELHRSLSKRAFLRSLQRLVPALEESDLEPGNAGVRAQAMGRDGALFQDFVFQDEAAALHVLSAPSPAATASLAIGRLVSSRALSAA
jgi:L-2-hydroxyglutarate oxidase